MLNSDGKGPLRAWHMQSGGAVVTKNNYDNDSQDVALRLVIGGVGGDRMFITGDHEGGSTDDQHDESGDDVLDAMLEYVRIRWLVMRFDRSAEELFRRRHSFLVESPEILEKLCNAFGIYDLHKDIDPRSGYLTKIKKEGAPDNNELDREFLINNATSNKNMLVGGGDERSGDQQLPNLNHSGRGSKMTTEDQVDEHDIWAARVCNELQERVKNSLMSYHQKIKNKNCEEQDEYDARCVIQEINRATHHARKLMAMSFADAEQFAEDHLAVENYRHQSLMDHGAGMMNNNSNHDDMMNNGQSASFLPDNHELKKRLSNPKYRGCCMDSLLIHMDQAGVVRDILPQTIKKNKDNDKKMRKNTFCVRKVQHWRFEQLQFPDMRPNSSNPYSKLYRMDVSWWHGNAVYLERTKSNDTLTPFLHMHDEDQDNKSKANITQLFRDSEGFQNCSSAMSEQVSILWSSGSLLAPPSANGMQMADGGVEIFVMKCYDYAMVCQLPLYVVLSLFNCGVTIDITKKRKLQVAPADKPQLTDLMARHCDRFLNRFIVSKKYKTRQFVIRCKVPPEMGGEVLGLEGYVQRSYLLQEVGDGSPLALYKFIHAVMDYVVENYKKQDQSARLPYLWHHVHGLRPAFMQSPEGALAWSKLTDNDALASRTTTPALNAGDLPDRFPDGVFVLEQMGHTMPATIDARQGQPRLLYVWNPTKEFASFDITGIDEVHSPGDILQHVAQDRQFIAEMWPSNPRQVAELREQINLLLNPGKK